MPALPEVEVVRRGLAPVVDGAVVQSVEVLDVRSLRRHGGGRFEERLTGRRMLAPERRGKFLWIPLASAVEPGTRVVEPVETYSRGARPS